MCGCVAFVGNWILRYIEKISVDIIIKISVDIFIKILVRLNFLIS